MLAVVADDLGDDQRGELGDGDVLAGADVDRAPRRE